MLTDEQIQSVYEEVRKSAKFKGWMSDRAGYYAEFKSWLDNIQTLDDDQLKKGYLNYFTNAAQTLNRVYRERIVRDARRFREVVKLLLDESVPVDQRLNAILDGDLHIEGMGKGMASDFLMIAHPDKYCLWNGKTEKGLERLGLMPVFSRGTTSGDRYMEIWNAVKRLKDVTGSSGYPDIDLFLHCVGEPEPEGEQALRMVVQGEEGQHSELSVVEPLQQQDGGFAYQITPGLENRLEEFIEQNLSKIGKEKLGRDLTLYQDEEGSGRQYSTAVGRIDLLAYDKNEKTWVIFELKRDIAGDSVVGQILGYIEWIKANKAKSDEKVEGVIVASGADSRIQYSLIGQSHVHLYTYAISFDLKPMNSHQ